MLVLNCYGTTLQFVSYKIHCMIIVWVHEIYNDAPNTQIEVSNKSDQCIGKDLFTIKSYMRN